MAEWQVADWNLFCLRADGLEVLPFRQHGLAPCPLALPGPCSWTATFRHPAGAVVSGGGHGQLAALEPFHQSLPFWSSVFEIFCHN